MAQEQNPSKATLEHMPPASAEERMSQYRISRTLGVGSFGKVKAAEHVVTGHQVAIKILNRRKIRSMDMDEKVGREIKILRLFRHPHIIRLYDVVETHDNIYVVMEYVRSGELFDYIVEKGRLLEDEARRYFQQIISGVEYCHRNMVVHRDLKPENLLLDGNMSVKIADFGLSNVMRDGHFLKTSCGSPNYAAPEVISGKLYSGPEVDVWSCGVILYALLCGSLPFDDESIPNLFKKIKGGIYNLPSHLSPGARDLIPRMLLVDPLKRITIPEIRQHPWFTLHLPRYLAVMQAGTVATSATLDPEIVEEVSRLTGYPADTVADSVKARVQDKASVAYQLVLDNKKRIDTDSYLKDEMTEAHDAQLQYPSGMMSQPHNTAKSLPQPRVVAERKWQLGQHSRDHPSAIMSKLMRFMASNHIAWKKNGPYSLKCCRVGYTQEGAMRELQHKKHDRSGSKKQIQVKFEVQIYKVRDGEYCIDIQRIQGELFLFMDLCGNIVGALGL